MDDDFEDLVQGAPGFGGLFYDEVGRLNVYLKNPAMRTQVEPALVHFLSSGNPSVVARKQAEVAGMNVVTARFDYVELATEYRRIAPIFGTLGIHLTDIDEANNRVLLGVSTDSERSAVASRLSELNTPAGLVTIEKVPPTFATQSLQDSVRPVPAAVQIAFGEFQTLHTRVERLL